MRFVGILIWLVLAACATSAQAHAGAAAEIPASGNGSTVVARTAVGNVTEKELDAAIAARPKLARQIYEIRRDALEDLILQRLVEAAAAKENLTVEAYLHKELDGHATPPTEAEVRAFFDRELAPSGSYRYEEIHDRLAAHLFAERRKDATAVLVERLRGQAQVQVLLVSPRIPVRQVGPTRGPANAVVTIVEFSDFQCPYCRLEAGTLHRLLEEYPQQVKLVFLDFPLSAHPDANNAAQAAACADEQGRFWAMHDLLFKHQDALSSEDLRRYASEAGVESAKFDDCMKSGRKAPGIERSVKVGEQVGVDGTPALFVNGRPLVGAVSYAELKQTIDEEIAAGTAPTTNDRTSNQ